MIIRIWCKDAILNFRQASSSGAGAGAGALTAPLTNLFSSLPAHSQPAVLTALGLHALYLATSYELSRQRAQRILDDKCETMYGAGAYLGRWKGLIDETVITPASAEGSLRMGRDVQFKVERGEGMIKGRMRRRRRRSGGIVR